MTDNKKPDPSEKSSAYNLMAPRWEMVRTLMAGTDAMRDAGKTYLPQFSAESEAEYQIRLSKTVLTNMFEDAVRNAASLPFKKPVVLSDPVPEVLKPIFEDVDMRGQDVTRFAQDVLHDGIQAGFSFILVDFTRADGVENLAQERALGVRPYWVHLKADDVVAAYADIIGGRYQITHLRYKEEVIVRNGFEEDVVERVRVYEPGIWQVWEKDPETNEWGMIENGVMPLPYVPIAPLICGRSEGAPFVVKPLFLDLAYKQIEHWQSSSDQRNILSFGRFPLLACSGVEAKDDVVTVGPGRMLTTTDAAGKWYYVEPGGQAIEAGRKDLTELKEEMRLLGLQPTIGETGAVTATARALDETRVHSAVQVLAMNLEDTLNQAISFTLDWLGLGGQEVTATVNRDFGISLRDSRELDALIRSRVAGELSRRTFWEELKRRSVLSADFDADREEEMLAVEQALGIFPLGSGLSAAETAYNAETTVYEPGASIGGIEGARELERNQLDPALTG
jgi:hypothetical protein